MLTIIAPSCIPSRQILAYERGTTQLKRSNRKSSKQFKKSLFMYLKERHQQLEEALYFKAVGKPKQAAAGASYGTV